MSRIKRKKRLGLLSFLFMLTFVVGMVFANTQGYLWFDGVIAVRGQPGFPPPDVTWSLPHIIDPAIASGTHDLSAPINSTITNIIIEQQLNLGDDTNPLPPAPLPPVGPRPAITDTANHVPYIAKRAGFTLSILEAQPGYGADIVFDIINRPLSGTSQPPPTSNGRVRIIAVEASTNPFVGGNTGIVLTNGGDANAWYNALRGSATWLRIEATTAAGVRPIHELPGTVMQVNDMATVGLRVVLTESVLTDLFDPSDTTNLRPTIPGTSIEYFDGYNWAEVDIWIRIHYDWDLP